MYKLAESRMRKLIEEQVDKKWFSSFFGEHSRPRLVLAVGLLNGGYCYGKFSYEPQIRFFSEKIKNLC